MKIIVCLKQVPDTAEIEVDPQTGTLNRQGVESIINPLDRNALEAALRLQEQAPVERQNTDQQQKDQPVEPLNNQPKERQRGQKSSQGNNQQDESKEPAGVVTVLSMGPKQARDALKEALAMGADKAVLCTDKHFAGADTWATAQTLAAAIGKIGRPDLVLCGKQAIDGDTAQVPAELAIMLGVPFVPYVSSITITENNLVRAVSMTEQGHTLFQVEPPLVCSVLKNINTPRLISLPGRQRAYNEKVLLLGNKELKLPRHRIGLKGSPTIVKKITPMAHEKQVKFLDPDSEQDVRFVLDLIQELCGKHQAQQEAPRQAQQESAKKETSDSHEEEGNKDFELIEPGQGIRKSSRSDHEKSENSDKYAKTDDLCKIIKGGIKKLSAGVQPVVVIGDMDSLTGTVADVTYELLAEAGRLCEEPKNRVILILSGTIPYNRVEAAKENNFKLSNFTGPFYYIETDPQKGADLNFLASVYAGIISKLEPDIVLGPATMTGRAVLPLMAARLKTGLTADCTSFAIDKKSGLLRQTRPALGGNILATIVCPHSKPQMASVRPHVLPVTPAEKQANWAVESSPEIEDITSELFTEKYGFVGSGLQSRLEVLKIDRTRQQKADIANNPLIFSGGRGLGEKKGFELLKKAAGMFGGAVGASRSAVEAGWAVYAQQVGQTGRTVQPKIYVACGISGAVQHLVGMRSADTVIAVNKDPQAPIFQAADYGFITDYGSFLSKLIAFGQQRL